MSLQLQRPKDLRRPLQSGRLGIALLAAIGWFCLVWLCLAFPTRNAAQAAEAEIGLRLVPPYVMENEGGALHGLEYELVRDVLAAAGHDLKARILPLGRLIEDFRRGRIGAFVPANPTMNLPGAFSDILLVYNNIGLSLHARSVQADRADTLRGLRILAFQNATRLLPGFLDIQERNPDYLEVADQVLQVRALFASRADLIVGERRILRALIALPHSGIDTTAVLREHALFPPTEYRVVFADARLRDDFNRALARYKADGAYDRALRRYDAPPIR